jgi:hypothetical protein
MNYKEKQGLTLKDKVVFSIVFGVFSMPFMFLMMVAGAVYNQTSRGFLHINNVFTIAIIFVIMTFLMLNLIHKLNGQWMR